MYIQSIKAVDKYDKDLVFAAIDSHFRALKIEDDLFDGIKVVIKPNMLTDKNPVLCVTTNPVVIEAIILWLKSKGVANIVVADTPGGALCMFTDYDAIYEKTQLKPLESIAKLNYDSDYIEIAGDSSFTNKSFNIINAVAKADYIINVAKLKTHNLTKISMGIKNLFGCIPGLQKPMFHAKYPKSKDFSNMLVELAMTIKPNLTVIDAIDAMEGSGPVHGSRRHIGLTFAAKDVFSQDYFITNLMGIDPESVDMLRLSKDKNLIRKPDSIIGESVSKLETPLKLPESFNTPVGKKKLTALTKTLKSKIKKIATIRIPVINEKCIGCAKCVKTCPVSTIHLKEYKAVIQYDKCISCFCCDEVCPEGAVNIVSKLKILK